MHARADVMNDDQSLDSEYEDESLSSEQLKFSPESDLSECSSVSKAKSHSSSSRKAGRKAVWWKNLITDMVDIILICYSEYLRTNLVFRNTSSTRNMAIYMDAIVKQLKERLGSRRNNFPFDVTQTRNKYIKCVAECTKTALTKKRLGTSHQLLSTTFESTVMLQSR